MKWVIVEKICYYDVVVNDNSVIVIKLNVGVFVLSFVVCFGRWMVGDLYMMFILGLE